jgi:hypothetical protein
VDELFRLIGLALPDTGTMLRLKVGFCGICGIGAGLLCIGTGLDGFLVLGALMAACGIALLGIASHNSILTRRRATGEPEKPAEPIAADDPARRDGP